MKNLKMVSAVAVLAIGGAVHAAPVGPADAVTAAVQHYATVVNNASTAYEACVQVQKVNEAAGLTPTYCSPAANIMCLGTSVNNPAGSTPFCLP